MHTCLVVMHTTTATLLHAVQMEKLLSMAEVVTRSLQEAAGLTSTCDSCSSNQHLGAVLSRAISIGEELMELIKNVAHGN